MRLWTHTTDIGCDNIHCGEGNVDNAWECWQCLGMLTMFGNVDNAWECWQCLGMLTMLGNVDNAWECCSHILVLWRISEAIDQFLFVLQKVNQQSCAEHNSSISVRSPVFVM